MNSNFFMPENYVFKSKKGLNSFIVNEISHRKDEPTWMHEYRQKALKLFESAPLPSWGGNLKPIKFNNLHYYVKPLTDVKRKWKDVPSDMKKTFDRLGIPEAEKKYLAGVGTQYESEMVYHSLKETLTKQGVIFVDTDTALKKYPELFKEYFGTVVGPGDNKFASLNSAVWSGGSFIYIPKNIHVNLPLQAYFRINAQNMGQFERTLIIADEGSFLHYIEGCTAPTYSTSSLHSAVVEIIVKRGARVRYTTIQNWSHNVYNLVTKRAKVYGDGLMEWVDGNIGSRLTMKYPCVILMEPGARGEVLSLAMAGSHQHQDNGAKMIHLAPNTSSTIISKSLSFSGGRTSYRGLVKIVPTAINSKSFVRCDALILDEYSQSDTYPTMDIFTNQAVIEHEASVSNISEDQLFYLQSRGLDEARSKSLIVNGFFEPLVKELPMEYAIELNRLIQMEMGNKIG